jgi:hypothetical protein
MMVDPWSAKEMRMPRHAIAQHQRQFVFANVEPRATNATANSTEVAGSGRRYL